MRADGDGDGFEHGNAFASVEQCHFLRRRDDQCTCASERFELRS